MSDQKSSSEKINKEVITHVVTGVTVLLKGADKVTVPEKLIPGIVLLIIGALILLIGIFHHKIERRTKKLKAVIYLFESLVMGLVGYMYLHDGKSYLQYACFLASAGFLYAAIVHIVKHPKPNSL